MDRVVAQVAALLMMHVPEFVCALPKSRLNHGVLSKLTNHERMLVVVALHELSNIDPDTLIERNARCALRGKAALRRAMKMGFGAAFLMASVGLWVFQAGAGDGAMQLIKLLISGVLLIIGLFCVSGLDERSDVPEIHIDPMNRQLRIVKVDSEGVARICATHAFDDLAEIALRDGLLTARDHEGCELFAIPVDDPSVVEALRDTMQLRA